MSEFFDFAERHELALLEVHAGQKRPVGDDWPNRSSKERARWEAWLASGSNLGVHAGASDIAMVDIEAGRWDIAAEWFRSELGIEIPDPHVSSARGGFHIFFRLPDSFKRSKLKFAWGDLIVGNSQTVAPPSCFDGKPYQFFSKTTELYDGAVLLRLWPARTREPTGASLDAPKFDHAEVAWWLDRKVAAGDWELSQLDWVMLGKALKISFPDDGLALQLHFLLKVRSLCFGLVSASPERPCDDASGLDTPLRELEGDTTDFLDRPADQERRLIDRRGNVFLGPTTAALAR